MTILIGASGHAKVLIDILSELSMKVEELYDARPSADQIFGVPVFNEGDLIEDGQKAILAVGNNSTRKLLAEKYNLFYVSAVHPAASVSSYAQIGEGTVVMAQASINPAASVGRHCIINSGSIVEHDCLLEDFVHISPNAALAGGVTVREGAHIGIGASVIPGITIGRWATVGAGAVVISDVPDFATVVGVPARQISTRHDR